ncbi:restriction endonuclease subunit S [Paenibacillaceae bacterium]|nr:restriction endonuclease subunit S [Paenibacillaceae bacterium]
MSREAAYLRMLEAAAKLQWNMATILDAKAVETEKVRNWICNHVSPEVFPGQQDLVKETLEVHDQMIEVIDGLSKMGQGISSMLKVVLRHDAATDSDDGMGGMFSGFPMGGDKS